MVLWPQNLVPEGQLKPSLVLQQGHAAAVNGVVLLPENETMVTASQDSTIRLWKVRDGARVLVRVVAAHTNGVTAMTLSAGGRYAASGDGNGIVRAWDLAENREKQHEGLPAHRQRITALAFIPGTERRWDMFVSLDQDGQTVLWDASGVLLKRRPLLSLDVLRMSAATLEGPVALALADTSGMLRLIGPEGTVIKPMPGTGGRPTVLHLSPDGRWLAAGDEDGRVRIWDTLSGQPAFEHTYNDRIGTVRLGPLGGLAVGAGDRLYLVGKDGQGPGTVLEGVADEVDSAVFSADGRWLAALTTNGNRHLWFVDDRDKPVTRTLPSEGRSSGTTCLAFDRDGLRLVAGEGDGGIRSWDLETRRERPRIMPHRGKVEALSVSTDGRFLLQFTQEHQGLIWDLKEGRGARTLPGRWTSGAFLPNATQMVMSRDANSGGDVVLVDRESGRPVRVFERPRIAGSPISSQVAFTRVAVSRDGRKAAATTAPGQTEIACVWDLQGGPPRVFQDHTRTITAVSFSADSRYLLTASEDGTARLWPLGDDRPAAAPAQGQGVDPDAAGVVVLRRSGVPGPVQEITAAEISPAGVNPRRIVTAHWLPGQPGQVVLWDVEPGKDPQERVQLGQLTGRPLSVFFSADGRWVGAAGQDKALHIWELAEGRAAVRVQFDPEHQHTEQVKALIAWPSATMIASGGDDTTVRLWTLDAKTHRGTLLGTLVAVPAPVEEGGGIRPDALPSRADWLAFTPDGLYDSSLDGDRMISFVIDREVRPLEQYSERFHKFQLTDELRLGARPAPPAYTPPPALVIDPLPAPEIKTRDIELKISLADPRLSVDDLRLFHNGVPVQAGGDFRPLGNHRQYAAKVHLRSGLNTFYAMAGRQGDIDARSEDVEIRFDGRLVPGRLHVLALGVKDYARNALRFASQDAEALAEHLHSNGIDGVDKSGEKIVLTDEKVTERSVEAAFRTLREKVQGRPEDVVVVFLAGHTDVLEDTAGRGRFSLLLKPFPFPKEAPQLAMNRGVGVGGAATALLPPGVDLPFSVIYRNLGRLDALQRLVIIDACQAEAIFDDPGVRRMQRVLERDTRRGRNSYVLAARRGEAANESSVLEHGLLTYVLLRGMQAPGLRPLPIPLSPFGEIPSADADGDGVVTSRELRDYADRTLPLLASRLPDLAQRSGLAPAAVKIAPEPVRIQASEGPGFRLMALPRAVEAGTASGSGSGSGNGAGD
jgi:WD40 repeat protein